MYAATTKPFCGGAGPLEWNHIAEDGLHNTAHGNAAPVVPRGDIDEQTVGAVFYIAKEQPTSAKVPLLTQRGALTYETQKN